MCMHLGCHCHVLDQMRSCTPFCKHWWTLKSWNIISWLCLTLLWVCTDIYYSLLNVFSSKHVPVALVWSCSQTHIVVQVVLVGLNSLMSCHSCLLCVYWLTVSNCGPCAHPHKCWYSPPMYTSDLFSKHLECLNPKLLPLSHRSSHVWSLLSHIFTSAPHFIIHDKDYTPCWGNCLASYQLKRLHIGRRSPLIWCRCQRWFSQMQHADPGWKWKCALLQGESLFVGHGPSAP